MFDEPSSQADSQAWVTYARRVRALYDELLLGVARKFPGETRHQTALRYIKGREAAHIEHQRAYGAKQG